MQRSGASGSAARRGSSAVPRRVVEFDPLLIRRGLTESTEGTTAERSASSRAPRDW
jgi:hypothetical protein